MGGQVTFFLNSTFNLSSNGWKLLAKGVNESCMSKHGKGGGGCWKAWLGGAGVRRAGWGLCLLAVVRSLGPTKHPGFCQEAEGGRFLYPLSLSTSGPVG